MADRFSKETAQQRAYRAFETMVAGEDDSIDLAQAALLIAQSEYPHLAIAPSLAHLDALAQRVRGVLALPEPDALPHPTNDTEVFAVIDAMNKVLFDEEHFHGNKEDYYNPENSFLNKVLENHTGIPITLSLLYMEIGRRVGIQIDGIGLPFHFVVRCSLSQENIYIDPYEGGLLMSEQGCRDRIHRITQRRMKIHSHLFEPVTHRQLLARILNNLKRIYIDKEDYERTLTISDLIVLLLPGVASEQRDRGLIHLQLKHYSRAIHDLTTYLELAPQAEDRYEILNQIKTTRETLARLN